MLNNLVGELSMVKYLFLLTAPYIVWFILNRYFNYTVLAEQGLSKRQAKMIKTKMINFQTKNLKYYQVLIYSYIFLWLSLLGFVGMFFGSYFEYGYFTNNSASISYAFLTLLTVSLILLENLFIIIIRFHFWNLNMEHKFFEESGNKPIINKSKTKIMVSISFLALAFSLVNICLFFNSTVY